MTAQKNTTASLSKVALVRRALVVTASTAVLLAAVGVAPSHADNAWHPAAATTTTTTTAH